MAHTLTWVVRPTVMYGVKYIDLVSLKGYQVSRAPYRYGVYGVKYIDLVSPLAWVFAGPGNYLLSWRWDCEESTQVQHLINIINSEFLRTQVQRLCHSNSNYN